MHLNLATDRFKCDNAFRDYNSGHKKQLKNVGPIRHNEPPHAHSADVASGTVARRLRIDMHDIDNNDNDNA